MLLSARAASGNPAPQLVVLDLDSGGPSLPTIKLAAMLRTSSAALPRNQHQLIVALGANDDSLSPDAASSFDAVAASPLDPPTARSLLRYAIAAHALSSLDDLMAFSTIKEPINVLVVDDMEINRMVLSALLAELSIDVAEAANGDEMLAHIRRNSSSPDLVLLDCHMPVKDGFTAARELRDSESDLPESKSSIPISAVTADSNATARALDAGMDVCLFKPITLQTVRAVVAFLVDRALPPDTNPAPLPPPLISAISNAVHSLPRVSQGELDPLLVALVLARQPAAAAALRIAWELACLWPRAPLIASLLIKHKLIVHTPSP
ncbi:uncharacterized protein AMSG_11697 [Thecamonas trahens ATCC 50062]|uniref:Response regulatory domain-containing protein n=1 Tax=Thecamonas trahens ATCC 50062 TaxID=461836 RepID=A0A0L0DVI9_THETB|nr:hypothetical protein AMSG_11697 [Thecamonas trahens ATCC 50062]KNC56187.1 hypothetical protein AMSG_11697 [Thecamonas trahens ATCC 50062]|eukprot:XP_013761236.1 hypothetical protein AMSG_11697 [Thecamonas trahens ATCC 50062]